MYKEILHTKLLQIVLYKSKDLYFIVPFLTISFFRITKQIIIELAWIRTTVGLKIGKNE